MAHPAIPSKAGYSAPKASPPNRAHPPISRALKASPKTEFIPGRNGKRIPRPDARRPSALHASQAPSIRPSSVDDLLRKECQKKFDFENHGGLDGLKKDRPTLVRVTRRVASLTGIPFNYLIASLYAESNLRTGAVNGEAKGIAQSMRIAWDQLKKSDEAYQGFKRLWRQLSAGQKLPSGPGQSPTADILFMAVWTLKREQDCPGVMSLEGHEREMARRLCYKLQGKATAYVDDLKKDGQVVFKDPQTNANWQNFIKVLKAAAPAE